MKTRQLLTLVFICLTPLFSVSQSYKTIFGIDTTEWDIPLCQLNQYNTLNKIAFEDTLINGITYKKAGTLGLNNSISYSMDGSFGVTNGFLREDSTIGKAWFIGTTLVNNILDTVEYLIMDMSLNVGDTFIVYDPYVDSIITTVDSVYYIATSKYVRLDYIPTYGNNKVTFIEGVGTNMGFAYMHESDPYNLCLCLQNYYKDNVIVYYDYLCGIIGGIEPIKSLQDQLLVYPHPISNISTLYFDNPKKKGAQLILYDVLGKKVESYITNNDYFELTNEKHFGIHFYSIQIDNQYVENGKLLFLD